MLEVSGSNVDQATDYPGGNSFEAFFSSSRRMLELYLKLGHDGFTSHLSHFFTP
jgi:hypothetical protein